MNTLKHFLAIALLLFLSFSCLQAQNGNKLTTTAGQQVKMPKKTPEQRAKSLTDTLSSVVSLSADQYEKAYTSNLKYFIQKESVKSNKNSELDEIKEKMKETSKMRKSEIAAILTKEQSEMWQTWKQARKAKHPNADGDLKMKKENKSIESSGFDDIGEM